MIIESIFQGPSEEDLEQRIRNEDFEDNTTKSVKLISQLINEDKPELIKIVLENGGLWIDDHFMMAVRRRNFKIVNLFIEYTNGEVLDPKNWIAHHPIQEAIQQEDMAMLDFLISKSKEEYLKDKIQDYISFARKESNHTWNFNPEILRYLQKIKIDLYNES